MVLFSSWYFLIHFWFFLLFCTNKFFLCWWAPNGSTLVSIFNLPSGWSCRNILIKTNFCTNWESKILLLLWTHTHTQSHTQTHTHTHTRETERESTAWVVGLIGLRVRGELRLTWFAPYFFTLKLQVFEFLYSFKTCFHHHLTTAICII